MVEPVRVPPVDDPDFVAEMTEPSVLTLIGSADPAAAAPLARMIEAIDGELCARKAKRFTVDVRSLDHMSSPCFKQLVLWVERLAERDPAERYHIQFRANPSITWQRYSLPALSCFDTSSIAIESDA
jgi:hypothetical protein